MRLVGVLVFPGQGIGEIGIEEQVPALPLNQESALPQPPDREMRILTIAKACNIPQQGLIFLVVNINVNYRQAVPVGATLIVATNLEKIGKRSAVLQQRILLKESGVVAADAFVTFVIADKSGRAVAMDGEILREINKLRHPESCSCNL